MSQTESKIGLPVQPPNRLSGPISCLKKELK